MHTIQNKWRQVRAWYGILSLRKKVFFWIGIAIGVLIIVSILKGKPSTVQVETVRRQDLARTVLASGKVVSSTDLALSFQKGDIVRSVRVSVGEKVQSGQVLATLDASEESAALTKAKGGLLAAEAAYRKVLEGNSDKEITVAQIAFENARRKLLSSDLVATPESIESADEAPVLSGTYNGTEEGEYRLE
ncbi:MAG TPA: biotin/lipoyl-binding protein, partial [Candidatus Paceibacterota bacterium]|nr:biotin/lipoyl-binding protein [Candidatus Paceibacterota bacterium]